MTRPLAVPTIDIGPFLDGDARARSVIAAQMAQTCEHIKRKIERSHETA